LAFDALATPASPRFSFTTSPSSPSRDHSGTCRAMTSPRFNNCELGGPGCTENTAQTWYCVDCQSSLCEPCWPQFLPHAGGRTGRDGPHEKVEHHVYLKLKAILEPRYDEKDLEELHRRDLDTTWFGTPRISDVARQQSTNILQAYEETIQVSHYLQTTMCTQLYCVVRSVMARRSTHSWFHSLVKPVSVFSNNPSVTC